MTEPASEDHASAEIKLRETREINSFSLAWFLATWWRGTPLRQAESNSKDTGRAN
jgi:hypothetical protein